MFDQLIDLKDSNPALKTVCDSLAIMYDATVPAISSFCGRTISCLADQHGETETNLNVYGTLGLAALSLYGFCRSSKSMGSANVKFLKARQEYDKASAKLQNSQSPDTPNAAYQRGLNTKDQSAAMQQMKDSRVQYDTAFGVKFLSVIGLVAAAYSTVMLFNVPDKLEFAQCMTMGHDINTAVASYGH